jgi:chromosomal replication initiation ATPase DnaA
LAVAWQEALLLLAEQVNKPTFEAHLKTLRPVSLSDSGEVHLQVQSDFTRSWIEKRYLQDVEQALSAALKRNIIVRLHRS